MDTETRAAALDFEDLLRSIDDATTNKMGLNREEVIQLAHGTASYLSGRGVAFTLSGALFSPGALSPIRMRHLIESRGLVDELWPILT